MSCGKTKENLRNFHGISDFRVCVVGRSRFHKLRGVHNVMEVLAENIRRSVEKIN